MSHRLLSGPADPGFPDVLRIYHASFSRDSREPDERLVAELNGEFRLPFKFLVEEVGGRVVGFARYCRLPKSGLGLLIHIAVDRELRGGGTGSGLLRAVIEAVSPAPLLVEIQPAGRVHDWYVRHGFHRLSATYTQPALHLDTKPVGYALYACGVIDDPANCIETLYEEAWELERDHPFVEKAIGR
jgi:N-acetylglutamate synthase-like GNAT family acetyltransferase